MTASTEAANRGRGSAVAHRAAGLFAAVCFLIASVSTASAQVYDMGDAPALPETTFRNDVAIGAGLVWQGLVHTGIIGPDQRVLSRPDWSFAARYEHVFADLPLDALHQHEVSRRMVRAGRVGISAADSPVMAMEPDELLLQVSAAGLVGPALAVGGRVTFVEWDGELYQRSHRNPYHERARGTMLAAEADIWLSSCVVIRESLGGGRYSREASRLPLPPDGTVLCLGHELHWDISPTYSYSHIVRIESWMDYRRVIDVLNRMEVALYPNVIGSGGLRVANFFTKSYFRDEVSIGFEMGVRYHPAPRFHVEATASTLAALVLFENRGQQEIQLGAGVRF